MRPAKKVRAATAALVSSCLVAACNTATGPTFGGNQVDSNTVPSASARLYFYRAPEDDFFRYGIPYYLGASIKIDGTEAGSVKFAGFNVFDVSPGAHYITVQLNTGIAVSCSLPLVLVARNEYFVQIGREAPGFFPISGALLAGAIGAGAGMAAEVSTRKPSANECSNTGGLTVGTVPRDVALRKLSSLKMTQ